MLFNIDNMLFLMKCTAVKMWQGVSRKLILSKMQLKGFYCTEKYWHQVLAIPLWTFSLILMNTLMLNSYFYVIFNLHISTDSHMEK